MTRVLLLVVAAAATLFHLYSAGVSPFTALIQRPVHLALMASLGFLGLGVRRREGGGGVQGDPAAGEPGEWGERRGVTGGEAGAASRVISWLLLLSAWLGAVYLILEHETLVRRSGAPSVVGLVAAVLTLVVVLELARRATGWGLLGVAILALAYAVAGPYLPGILAHRGYGFTRLMEHLYLSTEGIWGVPLGVSADFVFVFVLFGAVLEMAGGGALLIDLAQRMAGRSRGGPAKTAAFASALMGSLSGSAVANVVTTGSFTIPLMRRAGFRPFFAGAIEAAASTGGQLMPPVMGAGAFVLATWTNIPYPRVALAAVAPALLYYLALLMAIHFRAGHMGLARGSVQLAEGWWKRTYLLLPLALVVALLAAGRSPMRAAFWGVISALLFAFVQWRERPRRADLERALLAAGRGAVQVAAACAAAGVVVGVASLTGIGLRLSELIVTVSHGHLLVALLLTAAGSIVLGMGLPTTAAYVVLAALGAPALVELGVPLLAAHLFIFFFGCISNVTPPVALAAYAASGIAGSPPLKTAVTAMALASAGFLVPFMFVYHGGLLLSGSPGGVAWTVATAGAGVTALAAAEMGFLKGPLPAGSRVVLGLAALALIVPGALSDLLGAALLISVLLRSPGQRPPLRGQAP